MSWKTFSLLYWGCASFIPLLLFITQGLKGLINSGVGLWGLISVGVYAVACVAEWLSNRKTK